MFPQDNNQQDNQMPATGIGDMGIPDTSAATFSAPPTDTPVTDSLPIQNDTPIDAPTQEVTAPIATQADDDLLNMKQEALQHLAPLVDQLNQTPEEKFRTTMMMIQAADDQTLLKSAYETAKQITDEKTRAQALLDVVNEINYFTQQHHSN